MELGFKGPVTVCRDICPDQYLSDSRLNCNFIDYFLKIHDTVFKI